ncbi:hypothetical protein GQ53DRAFT_847291 [Thozetella sp. PMI_491]|nr:hypothetical protein GQ53DRAFT_847291 [Thozetella sp. PMI_491]
MGSVGYRLAVLVGLLNAASVIAAPNPQVTEAAAVPSNPDACASVSVLSASQVAASPRATPTVPASLAYQCLLNVPNKKEPAQKLIKSLKAFVTWQSTQTWLRDPPAVYMLPPVDLQAGFDNISSVAGDGRFGNEFDFQLSIVRLIESAHDGHFAYRPDVFKAFGFRNKLASDMVSVSVDGKEVPKLYHYADLMSNNTAGNGTRSGMPPSIVKINGEDAATVIERRNLVFSGYQDPDSQWNSGFPNYAVPGATTFVAGSLDFIGETLVLTYDNGEEKREDNFAIIRPGADFTGVNTGEDFYKRFCDPAAAASSSSAAAASSTSTSTATSATSSSATTLAAPAPTISGYPFPAIRDNGANVTSGYFLNGTGYDDVAVLSVTAFAPEGDFDNIEYLRNFQDMVAKFLVQCKQQNKKKLVIDVTGNGGGLVVAGYELFTQLFPDSEKFQADNIRETESLKTIARVTGKNLDKIIAFSQGGVEADAANNSTTAAEAQAFQILQGSSIVSNLVPGGVFSPAGQNLTSVDEILSPISLKGDTFTAYQSTPLNQTGTDFNLTGVGSRSNPPPAVFAPENIVLFTDGTCGSTCTLFSYLMIMEKNIRATSVGGRPKTGQMQSIAGVEGAQVFFLTEISAIATAAILLDPSVNVTDSDIQLIDEGYALSRASSPANAGAVNGKNAFSRADSSTPLQFLYQAANCRFFYTKEMIKDPVTTWKRAVDATWTDPQKFCVDGSMVALNSTMPPTDQAFFPRAQLAGAPSWVRGSVSFAVVVAAAVVAVLSL